MIPGATTGPRPAPRFSFASRVRYAPMALRLDSSAERSTRAVVQRTTTRDYRTGALKCAPTSVCLVATHREISKPRLLADEGELHGTRGAVALLGDDDLRHAVAVRRFVTLFVHLFAEDQ